LLRACRTKETRAEESTHGAPKITLARVNVSLPIDAQLPGILQALDKRGALVLVAEPGAGKTTRVPRALLALPWAKTGEILVLEPRRLAARLAAKRVAEEMNEPIGKTVGYTVRFDDVGGKETRLRFITEAVLTRRLVQDPMLKGVCCVVLDELHERSLHADVALAFVRKLRRTTRPDLRVVAMSATLDASRIAAFLEAEVMSVSGRPYQVEIEHLEARDERPLEDQVRAAVRKLLQATVQGHVLVFLPGAAEIRRAAAALEETARAHGIEVLPLHGDLPPEEQDRAVNGSLVSLSGKSSNTRKVILSTNVAETSITIDGVVAVIDSGLERAASFSPWSGVGELVTANICQASATQRAGRAGRTQSGRAIRLYTKHDHDGRPAFSKPEIQRVDFAETRLFLAQLGIAQVTAEEIEERPDTLRFFEVPAKVAIERAETTLFKLGALHGANEITELGRLLVTLPLHPRLARVAVAGARMGHAARVALLVALLSEKEIRLSQRARFGMHGGPANKVDAGSSDALARVEAFENAERGGLNAGRIRSHDLDVGATLGAARTRDQLARMLSRIRPAEELVFDEDEALEKALLLGYPDRVGKRRKALSADIVLAGSGALKLAETSVVRDAMWVVCVEAEEARGQVSCRVASRIEPEWLLELFPDRVLSVNEVRFDREKERIEKISALSYEGLLLDESRSDGAGATGGAEVLARAAIAAGLQRFVDVHELDQWKLRSQLAHKVDATIPVLDDAQVLEGLQQAAEGRRSLKELETAQVLEALLASLGTNRMKIDKHAPTEVKLPARKNTVTYEHDRPPWVESRMQDFFGLAEGPSAGGAPIVLHLLAPNMRAVQVTTDLAGFWERHYPKIRKELMRNYPKHYWPEDPLHAEAPPPRPPRRK